MVFIPHFVQYELPNIVQVADERLRKPAAASEALTLPSISSVRMLSAELATEVLRATTLASERNQKPTISGEGMLS